MYMHRSDLKSSHIPEQADQKGQVSKYKKYKNKIKVELLEISRTKLYWF